MGCLASKPDYIESAAGGEKEYLTNYVEGKTLGQVRRAKTRENHQCVTTLLLSILSVRLRIISINLSLPLFSRMIQGEFGVVKLVTDVREKDSANAKPKACKYLKKGYVFKDNTLYAPVKRSVLEGEVDILRRLDGKCYCLRLCDVYESPSQIYMITGEV